MLVEARLAALLDAAAAGGAPHRLIEAMRLGALGGGKRLRPFLAMECAFLFGVAAEAALETAAALECVHCYSLVHDDLPAMDDDDLRRGRPTCHRQFDEATAILAGDALQALAFESLLSKGAAQLPSDCRLAMVEVLAHASGSRGMAGGQALDLAAVGKKLTLEELENMHKHKTGALICASVKLGLLASGSDDDELDQRLERYATCIGLAFQVQDDILDIEGATEVIGKPQGSDADRDKPTYPNLLGMAEAKATARRLCEAAIDSLAPLGARGQTLAMIADFIVKRDR